MPKFKKTEVVEPSLSEVMASVAVCYPQEKEREERYVWHKINNWREKQFFVSYVRERIAYDPLYGDLYWKTDYRNLEWSAKYAGTMPYEPDDKTYRYFKLDGVPLLVHRVACAIMLGEWPKFVVDHANHDLNDITWKNIRPATFQENSRNKYSRSASGYKGVSRKGGKYVGYISVGPRSVHLGTFETALEAALAYDAAAMKYFKEFACTNKNMGLIV